MSKMHVRSFRNRRPYVPVRTNKVAFHLWNANLRVHYQKCLCTVPCIDSLGAAQGNLDIVVILKRGQIVPHSLSFLPVLSSWWGGFKALLSLLLCHCPGINNKSYVAICAGVRKGSLLSVVFVRQAQLWNKHVCLSDSIASLLPNGLRLRPQPVSEFGP